MKPPKIPSLFKLKKHGQNRQFEYKPRLYDEQKERLEKRQRQIEQELDREKRLSKARESDLRERIGDSWSRRETRRKNKQSNIMVIVISVILALIIYSIYSKFP